MTFREFHVLLRLYRAAPSALRLWADLQLPELHETAEMTYLRITHKVSYRLDPDHEWDGIATCTCGWTAKTTNTMIEGLGKAHEAAEMTEEPTSSPKGYHRLETIEPAPWSGGMDHHRAKCVCGFMVTGDMDFINREYNAHKGR